MKTQHVKESECEEIMLQFNSFLSKIVIPNSSVFMSFDPVGEISLDTFFFNYMGSDKYYHKLWIIVKKLLILSHGQADVERGFSCNKMIEVENLKAESFIAQRKIVDHMKHANSEGLIISKELRISVAAARQKYIAHLNAQKEIKEKQNQGKKRKCVFEELEGLKRKKKLLGDAVEELEKNTEKLAEKAESTGDIKYMYQSNSFRRSAKLKKTELAEIEERITEILKDLKKC